MIEDEDEIEEEPTYEIVRHFQRDFGREVIATGLTREEAKEHCSDPDSDSKTCTTNEGILLTAQRGPWFDGFNRE